MLDKKENDVAERIENALPTENMTSDIENRIVQLSNFSSKLEKMSPTLKKEFLEIIDDIIACNNLDKIIESGNTKKKC